MKKIFYLSMALAGLAVCFAYKANAQGGASVNTTGAQPDPSAMFDISSTNRGLLMPRMTVAQRDSIANPASGLVIYNTDCGVFNFNAGTPTSPNWATVSSSNVITAAVSISSSPVGAICAGTGVTFTATPAGGINSPTYQWQVNGVNAGTNGPTYTTSSLNNGDVVTCILSGSGNCVVGSPATSNAITMLVNTVPGIIGTTPGTICGGSAATLSATANLGNINWYANSTGGSLLSSGSSYTVSGLTQTTTYYVDATANGCTTASRTAVIATYYSGTPGQPGSISGPTSGNLSGTATYSVNAVSGASSYVWSVVCGVISAGQGTNSITVTWDSSGFGQVSVAASNPCGTSAAQTAGSIGIQVQAFTYTGAQQTFTVPNGASMLTFQVYGAQGGSIQNGTTYNNPGGLGGYAKGTYNVSGGEILYISIGGQASGTTGGTNGGGQGYGIGTGGGGGSDVRAGGTGYSSRIIVAGGGGGVSFEWISTGGSGGGSTGGDPTGGAGGTGGPYNGQGGTQSSGGQSETQNDYYGTQEDGRFGVGGRAGNQTNGDGGGGGGGYYGGGGGDGGPGGGGSGYTGGVNNGSMQNGVQSGNGMVIIYWQ